MKESFSKFECVKFLKTVMTKSVKTESGMKGFLAFIKNIFKCVDSLFVRKKDETPIVSLM